MTHYRLRPDADFTVNDVLCALRVPLAQAARMARGEELLPAAAAEWLAERLRLPVHALAEAVMVSAPDRSLTPAQIVDDPRRVEAF